MNFAQIDFFRRVIKVIVAEQSVIDALPGMYVNCEGIKNEPAIGFTFDYERNAFIAPKPYPSFILNEETCIWEAPIAKPNLPLIRWSEENQQWYQDEEN